MSADWAPGDLALCVRDGATPDNPTRSGRIYEVRRAWMHAASGVLGLDFAGVFNGGGSADFRGHFAHRFRKITPGADIVGIEERRRVPVEA